MPSSGNSPHHLGPSIDGKLLVGGGLLSLLKTQDTAYYFDTSNPYKPKFSHSNRALLSSITDEIRAKPDGGFLITYMGSAVGTSPGRLVETNSKGDIIAEHPKILDVEGTLNILGEQFSPHGLSVDWENNIILTSDYVVPLSILKPTLGVVKASTLRLWNLEERKIISTIKIPEVRSQSSMLPHVRNGADYLIGSGNPGRQVHPRQSRVCCPCHVSLLLTSQLSCCWFKSHTKDSAVGPGQVWIIYPFREDANGNQGVAELLYDLGDKAKDSTAIYSEISPDGKRAYFTITVGSHVAALDISDLNNVERLDDPDEDQPIIGPHYVKLSPDGKNLLVTGYFVQAGDVSDTHVMGTWKYCTDLNAFSQISVINTPGDYKGHWIDVLEDGSLSFNRTIDFEKIFSSRGGARPHSSVIFDLTDPENPIYY